MTTFEFAVLSPQQAYKLLIGSVVPRPIAWVCTRSADEILNIAPFSFFTVASREPPTLTFSVGAATQRDASVKDTLANIRATGDCTVNIASVDLVRQVELTGDELAPEVDEFAHASLTTRASDIVGSPLIAEAPIGIECTLDRIVPVGADSLVLVTAVCFHADDGIVSSSLRIDTGTLRPLARLAGPRFASDFTPVAPVNGQPILEAG